MVLDTLIPPAQADAPADEVSAAIVGMINRVKPSVVQVRADGHGAGAGVIWRASGDIITNNHVVAERRGRSGPVQVLLPDDRAFEARVVGRNPRLDLALLHVEALDLPTVAAGESGRLRIGDLVFAVGHPWGQRWTVTAGIVSGLGELPGRDGPSPYLRSDVLLRPGNSGGPLLNAAGAVIGINAMIFGGDLSVAIPSDVVTGWVAGLGRRRLRLGVGVQAVTLPPALPGGGAPPRATGLLVVAVEPGSPAAAAGMLMIGDVLLEAAGRPLAVPDALLDVLHDGIVQEKLHLQILRGGVPQALDIRPEPAESEA